MQAVYEMGDITTAVAMAHDAVLRQTEDGRFAVTGQNIAVTDPAACGEVVFRAYEITGDRRYLDAAKRMLDYLMERAPRTDRGILCHNEISFHEGYSPNQIWADSMYMAPPFLAVMGEVDEAVKQLKGMYEYLVDPVSGLIRHIFDAGTGRFVRDLVWTTGNGWALMGMARLLDIEPNEATIYGMFTNVLNNLLTYQLPDGRFKDILIGEDDSFVEGTGAMMMAAAVYRGYAHGWLKESDNQVQDKQPNDLVTYQSRADRVFDTMDRYVDEYGIIHEVCGCPDFTDSGTSAESMASYIMMHAFHDII